MTKKPIIGITFDSQSPGGYSRFPWYALRENYCSSISDTGGIPLPLTHELSLVEDYLSLLDGLIITGGDFDLDPKLYGETTCHPTISINASRSAFEMAMFKAALEKNIPILGICGGHQLITVSLGGTLIQHIPDEVPNHIKHERAAPHEVAPIHLAKILPDTMLHKIVGKENFSINSAHHQAVKTLGQGCVVNALAPDGIIEGFEVPEYRFCMGVQWHPEFFITEDDKTIFDAFIDATS